MLGLCLVLLLQAPPATGQPIDLPVSLDRVRAGLQKAGVFDPPPPRPWRGPIFRMTITNRKMLDEIPWAETWLVPDYVKPTAPPVHFEFLKAVTPEEHRAPTLYPGANIGAGISAIGKFIGKRIRASQEERARREVEEAMKAAGIKK